jgi:thiol-disulfide isomerase/thioredoxin
MLTGAVEGQTPPAGPTDARAQKSFAEAKELEAKHQYSFALDGYKKADKQDGDHCAACAEKVMSLGSALGDFKSADAAAEELIAQAKTPDAQAGAHLDRAKVLIAQGKAKKKNDCFADGEKETESALALDPGNHSALYLKGVCLANEQQDEAARQVFAALLPQLKKGSVDEERVSRYAEAPELVRARMAPAFSVTTMDGRKVSLDELRNKVVLIDFWATWCGPCREALPHMQKIAQEFEGQPLVVLSVSLDSDEGKWKDFVTKNGMTWLQYRDGGFTGPISQMFGVEAIPHTFTIDADGVLQDEHIGDASIEGKLKKLVAQAKARQVPAAQVAAAGGQ